MVFLICILVVVCLYTWCTALSAVFGCLSTDKKGYVALEDLAACRLCEQELQQELRSETVEHEVGASGGNGTVIGGTTFIYRSTWPPVPVMTPMSSLAPSNKQPPPSGWGRDQGQSQSQPLPQPQLAPMSARHTGKMRQDTSSQRIVSGFVHEAMQDWARQRGKVTGKPLQPEPAPEAAVNLRRSPVTEIADSEWWEMSPCIRQALCDRQASSPPRHGP